MSDQPAQMTPEEEQAARLTALLLGELNEEERRQLESGLSESPREDGDEIERVAVALLKSGGVASLPDPSDALREAVESRLANVGVGRDARRPVNPPRRRSWLVLATSLAILLAIVSIPYFAMDNLSRISATKLAQTRAVRDSLRVEGSRADDRLAAEQAARRFALAEPQSRREDVANLAAAGSGGLTEQISGLRGEVRLAQQARGEKFSTVADLESQSAPVTEAAPESFYAGRAIVMTEQQPAPIRVAPPEAKRIYVTPLASGTEVIIGARSTRGQGSPAPNQLAAGPTAGTAGTAVLNRGATVRGRGGAGRYSGSAGLGMDAGVDGSDGYGSALEFDYGIQVANSSRARILADDNSLSSGARGFAISGGGVANEQYSRIVENRFVSVGDEPLSTFSIDVDTASYANARRFLTHNQMPPANAIRIEEFINYFGYDYPAPKEGEPFSVNMEVASCPWQPAHQLVRIGLKGKEVPQADRPASNIVFLLDVSGSMQDANKLPLLKQAMKLLTDQLAESDRVSIVTYAGNAGLALDTTNGESKQAIRDAIDALNANGSTNGSAGIQLAYEKAAASFLKNGANRVILATDGDLNVGVTDDDALVELIKEKAASGVFLTVLGFGKGNLKDEKLEKLADNGNGMYAYIDSLREARKVLVEQISGSLVAIAKDVKIKVEFNPAEVAAYRLLGYENRLMSASDFDNDAKDAGEIGAGHTVTALYEIVPTKIREQFASAGLSLKYQRTAAPAERPKQLTAAAATGELLTLFLRYKRPDANESTLSEFVVENKQRAFDDASSDFQFAAAVAAFGMVLRNSEFRGNSSLAEVEQIASSAIGADPQGHRTAFLDLVRKTSTLQAPRR